MRSIIFLLFTSILLGQNEPNDLISFEYFYKKEMQDIIALKKELRKKNYNALKQIELAELYSKINCQDSAYATLHKVFEKETKKRTLTDEQYKELLFELHAEISTKHNYYKDDRYFLKQLEIFTKKDLSDKWSSKIEYEKCKDIGIDSLNYKTVIKRVSKLRETNFYKKNSDFQATILLFLGNVYTSLEEFDLSEKLLQQCLQIAKVNNDKTMQVYALINLGVNERVREDFNKAIKYLDQTDEIANDKYRVKLFRIISKQKKLVYEGLGATIAAKKQEDLFNQVDRLINDFAKNSNFYEIDIKYQTKEKDAKLRNLNDLENRFVRNKILYGILIILVFLLALYSFVRWKKSDANKKRLALEKKSVEIQKEEIANQHSTVVKELQTVKKLVVADHLMLKNNKKIYLSDLAYIKADDHYLEVFNKSKKDVVRSTISEILAQLPPNFAQSHRSFIVNKNYIQIINTSEIVLIDKTVIPLTRKYKPNF